MTQPDVLLCIGSGDNREDALAVWQAANAARGRVPCADRIARVQAKLADPDALLMVAVDGSRAVGMALAEPGRVGDGDGPLAPGLCHVSMVFVAPDGWGRGIGTLLLRALGVRARALGYSELQLWTGAANTRAQRLYRRAGFRATGRERLLPTGEPILHYERRLDAVAAMPRA